MKACTKCKQEKDLGEYYFQNAASDKCTSRCKVCTKQADTPEKRLRSNAVNGHANSANRHMHFNERKPFYSSQEKELIIQFYMAVKTLTATTGIQFVVDHIMPLAKGGEHRLSNLQCITWDDNAAKKDKLDFHDYTQKPSYPRAEDIAACGEIAA